MELKKTTDNNKSTLHMLGYIYQDHSTRPAMPVCLDIRHFSMASIEQMENDLKSYSYMIPQRNAVFTDSENRHHNVRAFNLIDVLTVADNLKRDTLADGSKIKHKVNVIAIEIPFEPLAICQIVPASSEISELSYPYRETVDPSYIPVATAHQVEIGGNGSRGIITSTYRKLLERLNHERDSLSGVIGEFTPNNNPAGLPPKQTGKKTQTFVAQEQADATEAEGRPTVRDALKGIAKAEAVLSGVDQSMKLRLQPLLKALDLCGVYDPMKTTHECMNADAPTLTDNKMRVTMKISDRIGMREDIILDLEEICARNSNSIQGILQTIFHEGYCAGRRNERGDSRR